MGTQRTHSWLFGRIGLNPPPPESWLFIKQVRNLYSEIFTCHYNFKIFACCASLQISVLVLKNNRDFQNVETPPDTNKKSRMQYVESPPDFFYLMGFEGGVGFFSISQFWSTYMLSKAFNSASNLFSAVFYPLPAFLYLKNLYLGVFFNFSKGKIQIKREKYK